MARKRRKNSNLRNEVIINLLPEKAKRDYILRMVAFIIVLIFIIINFFTIVIPRFDRLAVINGVNRKITLLESDESNQLAIFNQIPTDLYNVNKNKDVSAIEMGQLDVEVVVEDLRLLISDYQFSYLENVRYNSTNKEIVINTQFITPVQVEDFFKELQTISYVANVRKVSQTNVPIQNSEPREKVVFSIELDLNLTPKVGEGQ